MSSVILSLEPEEHTALLHDQEEGDILCNALMISKPKQPFWLFVLDWIEREIYLSGGRCNPDPVSCTGPIAVQRAYADYIKVTKVTKKDILLLPSPYFYPLYANREEELRSICHRPFLTPRKQRVCSDFLAHPNGRTSKDTMAVHHWHCSWCQAPDPDKPESQEPVTPVGVLLGVENVACFSSLFVFLPIYFWGCQLWN